MTTFNLIEEPWIPVLTTEGTQETVSIATALMEAARFRRIAAELPTISLAIQRLLQAILLRVHVPLPHSNDARSDLWAQWWESGELPKEEIRDYLAKWHDRFDLLDPELPFFQVPGLALPKGGGSGLDKIIADVPARAKFFTTRGGDALARIPFAEAAAWVVHAQAFDCAGIKSGVVGDARVKGGKNYSFGYPAWSGTLGLLSLEGGTLRETLLLNLDLVATSDDDAPTWERAPQRIASDANYPTPVGAAQSWTWPSRMIRLLHDGESVVDVVLSNGERLAPQNMYAVEPMTSWKRSEAQSKKEHSDIFMPVTHMPSRAAWRGLSSILAQNVEGDNTRRVLAGVLQWISRLQNDELLPDDLMLRLRCVGMIYGTQAATFGDIFEDSLDMRLVTLASPALRQAAVDAVAAVGRGTTALRDFARNVALASGDSGDNVADKHQELEAQALDTLGTHFGQWITELDDPAAVRSAATRWEQIVDRTIRQAAQQYAASAPAQAALGRTTQIRGKEHHMDLGKALQWLSGSLRKSLPLAHIDTSKEGNDDDVSN